MRALIWAVLSIGLVVQTSCEMDQGTPDPGADAEDLAQSEADLDAPPDDPVVSGWPDAAPDATDSDPDLEPDAQPPWGLDERPRNVTCIAPEHRFTGDGVALVQAFSGVALSSPTVLVRPPGDTTRFYVGELDGRVRWFLREPDATGTELALDLSDRTAREADLGLLGLAFAPDYPDDPRLFVSWVTFDIHGDWRTRVSSFTTSDGGNTFDPASEVVVLDLPQPRNSHSIDHIEFGADELLYIAVGDGGCCGDPFGAGQDLGTMAGKILRIDVQSAVQPYGIPADNPFLGVEGARPEIWAYGFRNPWRFSFDPLTGAMWMGDVGQDQFEEINRIVPGGNYGWSIREGTHCYAAATCESEGLIDPLTQYDHETGNVVTGGFVYRGAAIPALRGQYVFADAWSGMIWTIPADATSFVEPELLIESGRSAVHFHIDETGEPYVLSVFDGTLWRMVALDSGGGADFPTRLSETGCVEAEDPGRAVPGLIPYAVNAELWSDGAEKGRWMALPDDTWIEVDESGDFSFPVGTVLVKEFRLDGQPVETRLLMNHAEDGWAGYSYRWSSDGSDAVLQTRRVVDEVAGQEWTWPGQGDCTFCHTEAAGHTLGLEAAQLNRDFQYSATRTANQLETLAHIGVLQAPLGVDPAEIQALPTVHGEEPLPERARAYLHANCAGCHRPDGTAPGDLRFGAPLAASGFCDEQPEHGELGIDDARLIAPGEPERSMLWERVRMRGAAQMPPLATSLVDEAAVEVLSDWIESLRAEDCD